MVGFSNTILLSIHVALLNILQPPKALLSGLGSSRFARHYSGNHIRFLFLRVLRCFNSPGLPSLRNIQTLLCMGCPIRKSSDQSIFPAPRSISLVVASFIASLCQGIHRMPLVSYRKSLEFVIPDFSRELFLYLIILLLILQKPFFRFLTYNVKELFFLRNCRDFKLTNFFSIFQIFFCQQLFFFKFS
ncbi:MAG: hypothetical protein HW421_3286 [Ignavibacteria bacterium]|nr:hypothetical protein [Ignavibacteria bacterium]